MDENFAEWLKKKNYTDGSIKRTLRIAERVEKAYPTLEIPENIDDVCYKLLGTKKATPNTMCSMRTEIRRYTEYKGIDLAWILKST